MVNKPLPRPLRLNFAVLIFFCCELFTFALWDRYFNSRDALDRNLASYLVLVLGTLFSVAAGLFLWVLESRRGYLEKEIHQRTLRLLEKEKETIEEKQRLSVTLHSVGDGVITTDMKGNVVIVNEVAEILTGVKQEAAWGKKLEEVVKIECDRTKEAYNVQNLLDGIGIDTSEDMVLVSSDKMRRFVSATASAIQNERGSKIGIVLAFRDVTGEKLAEQQVKWAEEQYMTIFENSAVAITVTDEKEQIVSWNKFAESVLEMEPEDLKMRLVSDLYPEEEWRRLRLHDIRKKGILKPIETKMRKKNGQLIDVELAVTIMKNPEGKATGSIGIFRDITEKKEVDQIKDEFINIASHELRTPIAVVRETISQIADGQHGEMTDAQKQVLGALRKSVQRLCLLIDDLLDLSKIETGRVELRRELLDLREIAKDAGATLAKTAAEKGLEVRYDFPVSKLEAFIDREKITQVFLNLMGNGLKYTSEGRVTVSGSEKEDCFEITIQDTGPGISEEDLPKIFEKFQRFGPKRSPEEKGTGLGLALCRGIVLLHHGKISAESRVGEGTKIVFSLPKYTPQKLFQESVSELIRDSVKTGIPLSVLTFDLTSLGKMKEMVGEEAVERWAQNLERLIGGTIGIRGYVVRDGLAKLWAFFRLGKPTSIKYLTAIQEVLAAYLEKEGIQYGVNIGATASTFLEDASSEEEFLTRIL